MSVSSESFQQITKPLAVVGIPQLAAGVRNGKGLGDCSCKPYSDPPLPRHPQGHPNKAQFFTGAFMPHMARPCCLSTFTHGASPSLVLPGSCQPLGSSLHTRHLPASAPFSNLLLRAGMLSPRVLLEFLSGIPDLAKPVPLILFKIAPTPLAVSVE